MIIRQPNSWQICKFKDVIEQISNGISLSQNMEMRGIPVTRIETIACEQINFNKIGFIEGMPVESQEKYLLKKGDVLFSHINSSKHLGKTAVFSFEDKKLYHGTNLLRIRIKSELVNPFFFNYFCRHMRYKGVFCLIAQHAVNQASLNQKKILELPFFLPPRLEQDAIVNKIDMLFARVESCRAHLDRAAAAIKRFRQSIRNFAVTGALNQSNPDRWRLFSLDELGVLARGKSKHRPRNEPKLYGGPYPFIQTGDIANSGGKITSHKQTYSEEGLKQSKLFPAGTLCITIAANIADTAILTYPACFPDSVVGFISDSKIADNRFIQFVIDANKSTLNELATATAQKNINLNTFQKLKFKAPPVSEQIEIVKRAEILFALADQIESKLSNARHRIDNLTASILAKAFRGELV